MIAAPLALSIEATLGFRAAFLVTALAGLLWIPIWLVTTRADRIPDDDALAAVAAQASIYRGPEPREVAPERWIDVMTSGPVLRAVVAVIGAAPAIMFVLNWSPQYLREHWHMTALATRGYLVAPPLLFDLGAVGFGWWASVRDNAAAKRGFKTTHAGLIALATTLAALLALAPLAPSPAVAMAVFSISGCGGGGIYVLVTADMLSRVPLSKTSSAGGMTAAAQSLALVIAAPLVGWSVDRTHHYGLALVALGLMVIPTSLAFALWPGMRSR
jgi:ACS family hexuronate transporter-like MFS transporter